MSVDVADFKEKCETVLEMAKTLINSVPKPSSIYFFEQILSNEGIMQKQFVNPTEIQAFLKSPEYKSIFSMQNELQSKDDQSDSKIDTSVITVRLPVKLHESLKSEAHDHHTSLNKICVRKLLFPLICEKVERT